MGVGFLKLQMFQAFKGQRGLSAEEGFQLRRAFKIFIAHGACWYLNGFRMGFPFSVSCSLTLLNEKFLSHFPVHFGSVYCEKLKCV